MNQPIRIRRTPKEEVLDGTKMSRGTKMPHEGVLVNMLKIHKIQENIFFAGHSCLVVRKRISGGLF